MELSIIMPYHNEGKDFILETLDSIRLSADVEYEVIIIDDHSDIPLEDYDIGYSSEYVRIIRQADNLGVGAAFDAGVKIAKSNNLFLMGCDVRFAKNNWASKIVREICMHPKAFTCTSVVQLSDGLPGLTFEISRQQFVYNGATILLAYGDDDKSILQAKWLPLDARVKTGEVENQLAKMVLSPYGVVPSYTQSYEVPCILGAAYGVSKKWYRHVDGWWGHKKWGTLEPLISLKSWLFGGSCRTAPHIETAHIFKHKGSHNTGREYVAYNKMLTAWLLFPIPEKDRLIGHLIDHQWVLKGKEMIEENLQQIISKRNEYRKKFEMTIPELITKFNLK
jgi:glycosyltransferase involved in cell wall biosynthesis